MIIQISSGQGPVECSIAVEGICKQLQKEFKNSKLISKNEDYSGKGYKSCVIDLGDTPLDIIGTVQWICKSPVRENHKRKNWFVTISEISEVESNQEYSESDCIFETMHCGGHGGQNVNKVESGVRVKHIPTGTVIECTEERSQYLNKQKALKKLQAAILASENLKESEATNSNWKCHNEIVRGNPVRIYEGPKFKRIE